MNDPEMYLYRCRECKTMFALHKDDCKGTTLLRHCPVCTRERLHQAIYIDKTHNRAHFRAKIV